MSHKLENYLRMYRKRTGLTQDEVAYLLGCESGTKVSRYERFERKPGLETAVACAIVFGTQGRELFAGTWEKVEHNISKRAQVLARKLNEAKSERLTARKLEALNAISSWSESGPDKINLAVDTQMHANLSS